MRILGISAMLLLTANVLPAQTVVRGQAGPREVMSRDVEMGLARSAAPPSISGTATVLLWNGDGFEVGHHGSNGVTCYVSRSWPESLEPHCFDEEGTRTILPIHLRRMELRSQGLGEAEIDGVIAEGLLNGEFHLPTRPAMSYMMSARQELINDEGRSAGAWRPHLMIYFPYLTEKAIGLSGEASPAAAMVVDPGGPLSNIMVVVDDFAKVSPDGAGR